MSDDGQGHGGEGAGSEKFWEGRYQDRERIWSERVNPVLAEVAGSLPAGTALDLGCGEGADAVWLAQQGWRVTAADVSGTALQRAAESAQARGVADRIRFERHDLAHSFPPGTYDLVSAQYLHSPVEFPRDQVLQAASRAVAPGGLLLIVDHGAPPPWSRLHGSHGHARFATPEETLAALDLMAGEWDVARLEARERPAVSPDGEEGTLTDNIIAVRRKKG